MATLPTLKGLNFKAPKTLKAEPIIIPKIKASTIARLPASPKLFPSQSNNSVAQSVEAKLIKMKTPTSGPLKGTQPVIAGDPRYSPFYQTNQFGQLSTNIDLNNVAVQTAIAQKAVEDAKVPKSALDTALETGGSFLNKFVNSLQLVNPFEWAGVLYNSANISDAVKSLDANNGNPDFNQILQTYTKLPFNLIGNALDKIKDDVVDGVFGNGIRDQADRWRVVEHVANDLKSFVDVSRKYADSKPEYATAAQMLGHLSDSIQLERDNPINFKLNLFNHDIQVGGGKFKVAGFANDLTDFAVNWVVDPFKALKYLGLTKGVRPEMTFFNNAEKTLTVAKVGAAVEEMTNLASKDAQGFEKLGAFIKSVIPDITVPVTEGNVKPFLQETMLRLADKLNLTPEDIKLLAVNQPEKWIGGKQTLAGFLDPVNVKNVYEDFQKAAKSKVFVEMTDEGGSLYKQLIESYLSKFADKPQTLDDMIASIIEHPTAKMADAIRENPERYLYNSKVDLFDPSNRFKLEHDTNKNSMEIVRSIMTRPLSKLENVLKAGLDGIWAKLNKLDPDQAPIFRALAKDASDITPFIEAANKKALEYGMDKTFTGLQELLTPQLKQQYIDFFEKHINKFDLTPSAKSAFYADKNSAIPMLLDQRKIIESVAGEVEKLPELFKIWDNGISTINRLREFYGMPSFKDGIYFPRQFSGERMALPYYTEGRTTGKTFLDAQASFLKPLEQGVDVPVQAFNNDPFSALQDLQKGTLEQAVLQERGLATLGPVLNSGSFIQSNFQTVKTIKKIPELDKAVSEAYLTEVLDKVKTFTTNVEKKQIIQILKDQEIEAKIIGKGSLQEIVLLDSGKFFEGKNIYDKVLGLHDQIIQDIPNNSLLKNAFLNKSSLDAKIFESIGRFVDKSVNDAKFTRVFSNVNDTLKRAVQLAYINDAPLVDFGRFRSTKELLDTGVHGLDLLFRSPDQIYELGKSMKLINQDELKNMANLYEVIGINTKNNLEQIDNLFADAIEIDKAKKLDHVIKELKGTPKEAKALKLKIKGGKEELTPLNRLEAATQLEAGNKLGGSRINVLNWYDNIIQFTKQAYSQFSPSLPFTSFAGNTQMDFLLHGFKSVAELPKNNLLASLMTGEMRGIEQASYEAKGFFREAMGVGDFGNLPKAIENKILGVSDEIISAEQLAKLRETDPLGAKTIDALRKTNDYRSATGTIDFMSDWVDVGLSHNGLGTYAQMGSKTNTFVKFFKGDLTSFMYLNRYTDNLYKASIMRNFLKETDDIEVAVRKFNDFFKTYRDLAPLEKTIARRGFMFYLFQRNNFVNYFKALGTKEHVLQRTAMMLKMVNALQDPALRDQLNKLPADDYRRNVLWIGNPDLFALGGNSSLESALQTARLFSIFGGDIKGSYQALSQNANYPLSILLAFGQNKDPLTGNPINSNGQDENVKARVEGWAKMKSPIFINLFKSLPKPVQELAGFFETTDANTKKQEYALNPYINYMLDRKLPIPLVTKIMDLATREGSSQAATIADWQAMFTAIKLYGQSDLLGLQSSAQYSESARLESLMNTYNLGKSVDLVTMNPLQKQEAGLPMSVDQYNKASSYNASPLPYKDFNVQYTSNQNQQKLFAKVSKQFASAAKKSAKKIKPIKFNPGKLY